MGGGWGGERGEERWSLGGVREERWRLGGGEGGEERWVEDPHYPPQS